MMCPIFKAVWDNIRLPNTFIMEQKFHCRANMRRTAPLSGARKQCEGAMTLLLKVSAPFSPINSVLSSGTFGRRMTGYQIILELILRKGVVFVGGISGVTPFLTLKLSKQTGLPVLNPTFPARRWRQPLHSTAIFDQNIDPKHEICNILLFLHNRL